MSDDPMDVDPMEVFRQEVENFLERWQLAPRTFSELAVGYPLLVFRLRQGRPCLVETMQRARHFMRNYRGDPGDPYGKYRTIARSRPFQQRSKRA